MTKEKLIVASDGSDASKKAENLAATLANALQLPVDVVSVAQIGGSAFVSSGATLALEAEQAAEEAGRAYELREAMRRIREHITDPSVTVQGHMLEAASPAKAIIEYSNNSSDPVWAILMGNRGRGGFPRLLMGSVSDQVLKGADCPVIIVKA